MLGVGEHRVFLPGYPHVGEFARQVGKVGDLDAGDVVEIPGIVGVAADAIGRLADPCGNAVDLLMKALPLAGNGGTAFAVIAFADAGDEQRLARLETRGLEIVEQG